jgi:hypothetical protein
MHSALRLFRMILDVNSPAFNFENHQWRPAVVEVFYSFFSLIWQDEKVRFFSFICNFWSPIAIFTSFIGRGARSSRRLVPNASTLTYGGHSAMLE